ncbi:MAG TPA: dihydrofolate reductase, partial [Sedimentibacter sp.]|nr:dihydrofolate reductase [Sedimentibacter sp.]
MKLIVAVAKNWAIGYKGDLLFDLPDDMTFFKETTIDKVVVMGRKTLLSFPNGKPLKNRVNIILTRDK